MGIPVWTPSHRPVDPPDHRTRCPAIGPEGAALPSGFTKGRTGRLYRNALFQRARGGPKSVLKISPQHHFSVLLLLQSSDTFD